MLLFSIPAQCDLVLTNVDLDAGTFTIDFVNTTNCGGSGGPDGVSEIQIGFHALDPNNNCASMNQGWLFPSGYGLSETSNHPGWTFSATSAELPQSNWTNLWPDWSWDIDPPYYAGETITFPLYNQYQSDCVDGPFVNSSLCNLEGVLNYWIDEGYSVEAVIWQISYGPTMYSDEGGWAEVGPLGDGTTPDCCGIYDDDNFEDNIFIIGPCAQPTPGPDAIIDNIEFEIGCVGDVPAYRIDYIIYNIGNDTITDYCIELWNEDYYQCFDSDLFGAYEIPPGEGQSFSTPFFEFSGNPGGFFVVSVDSVNDEIVTGNNNTTVYYPDELENLVCPVVLDPDTIIEYAYDTIYIELPPEIIYDTLTIIDVVDNFIYDTIYIELPPDTFYVELPPDTIVELQIDTVFTQEYVYITDTITEYTTVIEYDTIYINTTDTLFIDNYIYELDTLYLTDTITEYIVQELYIDCSTGLPCDEDPPGLDCPDWTTIHIPNTFTPNNDGFNDVWLMKYDLNCWVDVEFEIYNRWGTKIYHNFGSLFDSYPYWDGSINGGNHYAVDGVYAYIFKARRKGRAEVIKKSGHITIFR